MQLLSNNRLRALAAVVLTFLSLPTSIAAAAESICLKSHEGDSLEEMAIACYSDGGCSYVEEHKGETLRDYDEASVAAALGREKIEGIVTSSAPIIKKITGYGYFCKPLP